MGISIIIYKKINLLILKDSKKNKFSLSWNLRFRIIMRKYNFPLDNSTKYGMIKKLKTSNKFVYCKKLIV